MSSGTGQRLRQALEALELPPQVRLAEPPQLVHVRIDTQTLSLYAPDGRLLAEYPVSTAANGPGEREGSLCTPTGWHRISEKIGDGEPPGRVFRGRQATGACCLPVDHDGVEDVITTRILRLEGLQPGHNRGGDRDSAARYIYLHGTPDEARIGQPVSHGCIRLRNDDIVRLFGRLRVGDAVLIEAGAMS